MIKIFISLILVLSLAVSMQAADDGRGPTDTFIVAFGLPQSESHAGNVEKYVNAAIRQYKKTHKVLSVSVGTSASGDRYSSSYGALVIVTFVPLNYK